MDMKSRQLTTILSLVTSCIQADTWLYDEDIG